LARHDAAVHHSHRAARRRRARRAHLLHLPSRDGRARRRRAVGPRPPQPEAGSGMTPRQRRGAGTIIPPETTEWRGFRDEPNGPSLRDPVVGGAVEVQVARDMARRVLPAVPVLVGVSAAIWGAAGAWSS